jgi:hypothetical protein
MRRGAGRASCCAPKSMPFWENSQVILGNELHMYNQSAE